MLFATLAAIDYGVIAIYMAAMLAIGVYASRRQRTEDDYFLAGRNMPWWAVGMSVIASLMSSLTYIAEPGEVWNSGLTSYAGKMIAIPLEMILVWAIILPFITRFRYTSAYEYLDERFGPPARVLGVVLFLLLVVAWTGFIVLATSRAVQTATGIELWIIIGTVGVVTAIYTVMGGLRAVIWTDVWQVFLMVGGALFVVVYVCWITGSDPRDWYATMRANPNVKSLLFFSLDPFERSTIVTAALSMFVWHVCTHTANQITVQRYFSTSSTAAARKSFVTGSLMGVVLNSLLMLVGLAIFYYYQQPEHVLPSNLDLSLRQATDNIFPHFMMDHLPAGAAGMLLAAILAASMSSIDSGINSMATVITVEYERQRGERRRAGGAGHLRSAMFMTFVLGIFMTGAAYALDLLPAEEKKNLFEMMPKTFNCYLTPLAALFFIGMFLPRAGTAAAVTGAIAGLVASLLLAYPRAIGLTDSSGNGLSFTLVMPGSLAIAILTGLAVSAVWPASSRPRAGLTWWNRDKA